MPDASVEKETTSGADQDERDKDVGGVDPTSTSSSCNTSEGDPSSTTTTTTHTAASSTSETGKEEAMKPLIDEHAAAAAEAEGTTLSPSSKATAAAAAGATETGTGTVEVLAADTIIHVDDGELIAADSDDEPIQPLGIDSIRSLYFRRGPPGTSSSSASTPGMSKAEERMKKSIERRRKFMEAADAAAGRAPVGGGGGAASAGASPRVSGERRRSSDGRRRSYEGGSGSRKGKERECLGGSNHERGDCDCHGHGHGSSSRSAIEYYDDSGDEDGTSSSKAGSEVDDDDDSDEDPSDSEGECDHDHEHCDHEHSDDGEYSEEELDEAGSTGSSQNEYQMEFGRRYFDIAKYPLPNDKQEQERLDMMHWLWFLVLDGQLHLAPIPTDGERRALDLGTGTGLWATEFADRYPDYEVLGTDLSAIQPRWVPPNVTFSLADITEPWDFAEDLTFDYIHIRNLIYGVKDWPALLKTAYNHLSPGGYIEIQESDLAHLYATAQPHSTIPLPLVPNSRINRYLTALARASARLSLPIETFSLLSTHLSQAGFKKIVTKEYKIPLVEHSSEPKQVQLAKIAREVLGIAPEGYALGILSRGLGWEERIVREMIRDVAVEMEQYIERGRGGRMFLKWSVLYARKPLNAPGPQPEASSSKAGQ